MASGRDEANVTFVHSEEHLYSPAGMAYQRAKYGPKIALLRERFGDRFDGVRLLDVGVGYGVFLHLLETEHGLGRLFGMDPFPDSVAIARRHTGADIRAGNILDECWPFDEASFDAITCFDVVEHLERPAVFFERAARWLAPGGVLVVTTPLRLLPYELRRVPFLGVPDRNPTHVSVLPPGEWRRIAEGAGWRVVRAWRGEHLAHVRLLPRLLRGLCRLLRVDHRRVPVLSAFEQAFCMLLDRPE